MSTNAPTRSSPTRTGDESKGRFAGLSPKERKAFRYRKLLEAGIGIIGSQGYEAATLRAVCRKANLTERYFYESFENREALFIAGYQQVNSELMEAIQQAVLKSAGKEVEILTTHVLNAVFRYIRDRPERGRLLMIEALGISDHVNELWRGNVDHMVEFGLGLGKPFLPAGAPPDNELRVMSRGAVGAIIYLCQQWILTGYEQPIDELVSGTEKIFFGLIQQVGIHR